MLKLEFPNISHKSAYLDMIAEWGSFESIPTDPRGLFVGENYEDFLQLVKDDLRGNLGYVPATLFFLMDDSQILGAIQIRHHIETPFLKECGGHIGYGIRPSERRKGYAKEMLRLGLVEAKNLGIKEVLLGCYDDNLGSYKTIEANGGVFDRYSESEGKKSRRYWITL